MCKSPLTGRLMCMRASRVLFTLAIPTGFAAAPLNRPALAQRPAVPRDSVPHDALARDSLARDSLARDTLTRDSVRVAPHSLGMYLILPVGVVGTVAITAVMAAAPAALTVWFPDSSRLSLTFLEDHRAVYVTVGGLFSEGQTWAHSANIEVVRNGVLTELKVEGFYRPRHFQYLTARGAYLLRPKPRTAAGVSVGYRHAHRDRTQAGLEIGLPLFVGDSTGTMRLEPTYVITRYGALWSYRVQIDVNIPRTPYFAGLSGVGKSVPLNRSYPRQDYPKEDFFTGAVMLLFGARF